MAQIVVETKEKKSNSKPRIWVKWKRFYNDSAANLQHALERPTAFAIYGSKGAGKSALCENLASRYRKVIDVFGSRDNEGLAWCRSQRGDKVLFLKGASVEIDSQWPSVNATDISLKQISNYDAVVSCSAFYSDIREEWYSLNKLMQRLWLRMSWSKDDIWCLLIREAANLLYSRIAIGDSQAQAKNYIIYVLREMRHCGYALALDSIRWFSIDIDARSIADYTFLKAQGIEGLPDNLRFLYRYFKPFGIMRMGVEKFALISRAGPIGYGRSTCPYWHKQEYENLLQLFDIKIDYKEVPEMGDKASYVGDYEHVRIVQARFESHEGMEKLANKIGRSSRTVHKHITYHNATIQTLGECDKCTRVKSLLAKQPVS